MPTARCVIYGGGGFIGSHIAEQLLADHMRVAVFDKRHSSLRNIEHIISDIDFIEGDFSNRVDVRDSLKGQDYAIHLVSATIPATSNQRDGLWESCHPSHPRRPSDQSNVFLRDHQAHDRSIESSTRSGRRST
jgi:nucleoside-diphosphate-sugar epimerase